MEIMGQGLGLPLKALRIAATKTYASAEDKPMEVWELSEEALEQLERVEADKWNQQFSSSWWRLPTPPNTDKRPLVTYLVNGEDMKGYYPEADAIFFDEEEGEPHYFVVFDDFYHYLEESVQVTKNANKVVFACGLATINELSIADFMRKYQG